MVQVLWHSIIVVSWCGQFSRAREQIVWGRGGNPAAAAAAVAGAASAVAASAASWVPAAAAATIAAEELPLV